MSSYIDEDGYDYLLSEMDLDRFSKIKVLPRQTAIYLIKQYDSHKAEIDHIFDEEEYTFDEFIANVCDVFPTQNWTEVVILRKAKVMWKTTSTQMPLIKRYKSIISGIFNHYRRVESKMIEDAISGPSLELSFVTRQEFDSNNATDFEELSNAFLIGIQTYIEDKKDLSVLLLCFEAVVSQNYWRFEDIEELSVMYNENTDEELDEEEIQKLAELDIPSWIEVLRESDIEMSIYSDQPSAHYDYLLRNRKTGKLANPQFAYFEQKYFTLDELSTEIRFRLTIS